MFKKTADLVVGGTPKWELPSDCQSPTFPFFAPGYSTRVIYGQVQALAGSRESQDFKSAKIQGFLKLKSQIFCDFLSPCFGPLGTL